MSFNYKELFKKINVKMILKYALFLVLTLIVQNMLLTQFRPFGVCPLVLPAAVVAVSMFQGVTGGAIFGLIMGIFGDMAFIENTILFTVSLPVVALAAGFIAQFYMNRSFISYMGIAALATLAVGVVQMLKVSAMDGVSGVMFTTVLLQTLWSVPLSAIAYLPPTRWIK